MPSQGTTNMFLALRFTFTPLDSANPSISLFLALVLVKKSKRLGMPQNITSFSVMRTPSPRKGRPNTLSIFSTSGQANTISGWLLLGWRRVPPSSSRRSRT
jgi:hypothetical protein